MPKKLTVDPEFSEALGELTAMQLEELRAELESEGWRSHERIIVWANHDDTIIDGHNRYKLCHELGIEFKTQAIKLDSREDVLKWMYCNQAGRRNWTREEESYFRHKVYESRKMTLSDAGKSGGRGNKSQSQDADGFNRTADAVGAEFGVSGDTILRDHKKGKKIDEQLAAAKPEERPALKRQLLKKEKKKKEVKQEPTTEKGKTVSWSSALSKASRKKYVTKESMADIMQKSAIPDVRKGLAILEQGRGFVVERAGNNGNYRVRKAFSVPVEDAADSTDLLSAIKKKAKDFHERLRDSSNVHWRWDLSLEFADDLLKMLKDVK